MQTIRHPELATDIRDTAMHYAEVSGRVHALFWRELDAVLASIERNPRAHHYDACGLRRANFQRFPFHVLYEVDDATIFLVVLRHDRRHPTFGLDRQVP